MTRSDLMDAASNALTALYRVQMRVHGMRIRERKDLEQFVQDAIDNLEIVRLGVDKRVILDGMARFKRLTRLDPGDVVILEAPGFMTEETAARLRDTWDRAFPDHKCVVLCDGLQARIEKAAQR